MPEEGATLLNVSTYKGHRRSFLVRQEDELGRRVLLAKRACERPDGSRPKGWLLKIVIQEFPNAKTDPRLLEREKCRVRRCIARAHEEEKTPLQEPWH